MTSCSGASTSADDLTLQPINAAKRIKLSAPRRIVRLHA
jgi:hypothetical protein